MRPSLRRGLALLSSLAVFLSQAGCAHGPRAAPERLPGRVGIVAAGDLPEVALDVPGKGRIDGAVRGAGRGFLVGAGVPLRIGAEGLRGCSGEACGVLAVVVLALAAAGGTVGAVVGGVDGAIRAMPRREATAIEKAARAYADMRIQEAVRDRVQGAARSVEGCGPVRILEGGPAALDCVVDYGGWAARGIDTLVETRVVRIGLRGEKAGSDPPLSAFLDVRARLIDPADGREIGARDYGYSSGRRSFAAWSADGGAPLKEEFLRGYDDVAARIAGEMVCGAFAPGAGGRSVPPPP